MDRAEAQTWRSFYENHLIQQILPFWQASIDEEFGGIFTGYDNAGTRLIHKEKYTWSQGRSLWIWSRLAQWEQRNQTDNERQPWLRYAEQTRDFIMNYAFMPEGHCRFLLTRDGEPKEMIPGKGHDLSFYADCFVIMGLAEYAKVAKDRTAWLEAKRLFWHTQQRLQTGRVRSEPYPVPEGLQAHGFEMIMLNTSQILASSYRMIEDDRQENEFSQTALQYADNILDRFMDREYRTREMIDGSEQEPHTMLMRHLNPGHTLESLWFVLSEVAPLQDQSRIQRCVDGMKKALALGWDQEYGGLLRYVDLDGGRPQGTQDASTSAGFEQLIADTWDTKLWWVHSEAIYACLLAYIITEDEQMKEWHQTLHDYTFKTFPAETGKEWIQIRNRSGQPLEKTVALPVKDPYHIARNLILAVELLDS